MPTAAKSRADDPGPTATGNRPPESTSIAANVFASGTGPAQRRKADRGRQLHGSGLLDDRGERGGAIEPWPTEQHVVVRAEVRVAERIGGARIGFQAGPRVGSTRDRPAAVRAVVRGSSSWPKLMAASSTRRCRAATGHSVQRTIRTHSSGDCATESCSAPWDRRRRTERGSATARQPGRGALRRRAMRHRVFMTERTVQWQGVDDPERFDEATIRLGVDCAVRRGHQQDAALPAALVAADRRPMGDPVADGAGRCARLVQAPGPPAKRGWSMVGRWRRRWCAGDRRRSARLVIDGSAWSATDGTEPGSRTPPRSLAPTIAIWACAR